jgi:predicted signal transduction protein with EAL and GGDEF domain
LESPRAQKIAIAVLAALLSIAIVLLSYGMASDNDTVAVLGFCIGIPVLFALIVNLGMLFAWSEKR